MTSPGDSVTRLAANATIVGMSKIMSAIEAFWRTSPLTRVVTHKR
jgi:hypothetical protein